MQNKPFRRLYQPRERGPPDATVQKEQKTGTAGVQKTGAGVQKTGASVQKTGAGVQKDQKEAVVHKGRWNDITPTTPYIVTSIIKRNLTVEL